MCGIGGVWGPIRPGEAPRLAAVLADRLAHRGPDGEGFLSIGTEPGSVVCGPRPSVPHDVPLRALLVHRRLSIIDLATGDQPMTSADGDLWIVYNGEIYNFVELRDELRHTARARFCTSSDTEVILQAYRAWGIPGLRRLNGIFAFALVDVARQELILARDPIGVKPLYWSLASGRLAFASEMRPLFSAGLAAPEISPDGIATFLFYRFVPAPATIWRDIHKVAPGHALRFNRQGDLVEQVDFAAPLDHARDAARDGGTERLSQALKDACTRQLVADVPLGAFLSGGLDSSLVVAALGPRARGLSTFAVGFPGNERQESELAIARRAADLLGTHHVERELDAGQYFARFAGAIEQVEEPLAHPGMLLQSDLSRLARDSVKVVLTGQGADEPLGGYPRHHAARVLPLLSPLTGPVAALSRLVGGPEYGARVRRVLGARPGLERVAALYSPLTPEQAGGAVRGCGADRGREVVLGALRPWWDRSESLDEVGRALYVDVRTSLAEDLLVVADKMSMAHGLELRVPFLDLEYLRAVESIPGDRRVAVLGRRKAIQHQLAARMLPSPLARALRSSSSPLRRKRAFDVPVAEWFRGPWREKLASYLSGPDSVLPGFVDGSHVRRAVSRFLDGGGRRYREVLSLFVLETVLRAALQVPATRGS